MDAMIGKQGRRPTIRDVAERAGVSMQTVSNVINDRPVTRPETRLRVEQAIRELGYERDALARALRLQRSHVVGFFIEDQSHLALRDPTHSALLTGMVEAARQREYAVTVLVAAPESTEQVISTLRQQQRVAGVLLSLQGAEGERRDLFEHMAGLGMPTVIFEQHTDVPGVASVTSDNEGGGGRVARHLLDLGHRRLAMLTGATAWPGGERRFAGFLTETASAGLEVPLMRSDAWSVEAARAAALAMLGHENADERPTAVFAANDVLAVGVLLAAQDLGLRVPDDLSVAGFDDFDFATMVRPALTTVSVDFVQMGMWGAEVLITLAEGGHSPPNVRLPSSLVVRGSTGSPPS
jgi:LacI family transcriptional regulator